MVRSVKSRLLEHTVVVGELTGFVLEEQTPNVDIRNLNRRGDHCGSHRDAKSVVWRALVTSTKCPYVCFR